MVCEDAPFDKQAPMVSRVSVFQETSSLLDLLYDPVYDDSPIVLSRATSQAGEAAVCRRVRTHRCQEAQLMQESECEKVLFRLMNCASYG